MERFYLRIIAALGRSIERNSNRSQRRNRAQINQRNSSPARLALLQNNENNDESSNSSSLVSIGKNIHVSILFTWQSIRRFVNTLRAELLYACIVLLLGEPLNLDSSSDDNWDQLEDDQIINSNIVSSESSDEDSETPYAVPSAMPPWRAVRRRRPPAVSPRDDVPIVVLSGGVRVLYPVRRNPLGENKTKPNDE